MESRSLKQAPDLVVSRVFKTHVIAVQIKNFRAWKIFEMLRPWKSRVFLVKAFPCGESEKVLGDSTAKASSDSHTFKASKVN